MNWFLALGMGLGAAVIYFGIALIVIDWPILARVILVSGILIGFCIHQSATKNF